MNVALIQIIKNAVIRAIFKIAVWQVMKVVVLMILRKNAAKMVKLDVVSSLTEMSLLHTLNVVMMV